jgi:penicillin V acylase-like amidase (Ntn superfamily)
MKRFLGVMALALAVTTLAEGLEACSTFCVNGFFARNYDFEIGDGMLVVNPAGLRKQGFEDGGPAWTTRFGSVTFNQFGRDHPMGGMNERALVIELLWLDEARYPDPDRRQPLGVLEWIQYQLDTAVTVQDVLDSDRRVRIEGEVPLHYLVSDASGRSATIEFLAGKLVAHTGAALPVPVLTNSTYKDSLAFLQARGGRMPAGSGSKERFARAGLRASALSGYRGANLVPTLFGILDDVSQPTTRWSIVYDQAQRVIHFRTDVHRPVRYVRMEAIDFRCASGARLLDIDTRLQGDVTMKFKPYTTAANLAFVTRTYAATSVTRDTPASTITAIANHPARATCM